PRVAMVLRPHPLLTPTRLATLTQALVAFQKATDCCVLLLPFQPNGDRAIAEQVAAKLPGPHEILTNDNPAELFGIFRGVEMAIGMRLHGLIAAAAEECRCFALSYDPKVDRLMAELDLPGWNLAELPLDANAITRTWLEHYANDMALDPARISSLADRALLHRDLLCEALVAKTPKQD
ncbi:MAG: polysaccharide pyruvyl transferase family protein, partial [Cyanobacteria bacterium J06641_5]